MSSEEDDDVSDVDRATMRALADAIGEGSVPRDLTQRCEGLLAWLDVDAELATLLDQPAGELAGTRGAASSTGLEFTIADGSCTIELEISDDALDGQVLGGRTAEMQLRTPDGAVRTASVDDLGFFVFPGPPRGTSRLECELDDGRGVRSDWFVF